MGINKIANFLVGQLNLFLMIAICLSGKNGCYASEISFVINPNCTSNCSKPWLVYGRQENGNGTVHYLWSAVELPSFLMAYSILETSITVDWDKLQMGEPGAILFTPIPENLFGISFQTLILFDDIKDTGTLDNIPEEDKYYACLSEFEWEITPFNDTTANENTFSFYTTSFDGKELPNDTRISISVTSYGTEGRGDDLPHLLTTPFSSQLKVVLDNLVINLNDSCSDHHHHPKDDVVPICGFDHPRWAFDAIIVSNDKNPNTNESGIAYEDKKSLDDEYSPGVFDVISITTEGAREQAASPLLGGYLQWRPVCYLTSDQDVNYATYPNLNTSLPSIDNEHLENAKLSIFYSLFGNTMKNLVGAQTTIAFGLSKDKFYTEYNYTEWTFSMGLAAPPKESFSTLIIIIISIAVGVPCAVFIFGGVYLLIRKMRRRGNLLINE